MKHTLKITLLLVLLFFIAQIIGLAITNAYIDYEATKEKGEVTFANLPYDIERPPVEERSSFIFIITAVIIGTLLLLLLIKFKKTLLWKIWFFLAVFLCLSIAFSAFINHLIALLLGIILAAYKIFKPNIIIHNVTEVFVYGGLAAIFVPIMNVFAIVILLILISIYDFIAVFKMKHMVTMAKFQTKSKVFAGLLLPYERGKKEIKGPKVKKIAKTAILGGGDIGFPLLFAGVVMKGLMLENTIAIGFLKALIIPIVVSIALLLLLIKSKKDKFYPAMPFLTVGCFIGYFILLLINLI
jgi:presenilin-like A22 family membrane protease